MTWVEARTRWRPSALLIFLFIWSHFSRHFYGHCFLTLATSWLPNSILRPLAWKRIFLGSSLSSDLRSRETSLIGLPLPALFGRISLIPSTEVIDLGVVNLNRFSVEFKRGDGFFVPHRAASTLCRHSLNAVWVRFFLMSKADNCFWRGS